MTRSYCIIRPIWFDFDGTKLDEPFIMPIMYSLFETKVLEFEDFDTAFRYTSKMNEICKEPGRYRIVLVKVAEKYARQVVDRYRECTEREVAAKAARLEARKAGNCTVLRIKRRKFTP